MLNYAAVFPGQGAQYVGMGAELLGEYEAAREIFQRASEALGWDLGRLVSEGPEDRLNLTAYTQPALLTLSVTAWEVFRSRVGEDPEFSAGLSLGEYSALVAAGTLELEDAVRLVHLRGQYMQEAVPAGVGGMAAVLGLDKSELESICREESDKDDFVTLANLNCPGQIVISGHMEAVKRARDLARERGARRAILLPVSAPFHSELMLPARDNLERAMEEVEFRRARFPVISNARVVPLTDPAEIRRALSEQMTSPVRWEDSVRYMLDAGLRDFFEFGPKATLTGFLRRIDRSARGHTVETPKDIDEAVSRL
ncbi:MAG: ACP S-malonyltransferase [Clostridia bacterium]